MDRLQCQHGTASKEELGLVSVDRGNCSALSSADAGGIVSIGLVVIGLLYIAYPNGCWHKVELHSCQG